MHHILTTFLLHLYLYSYSPVTGGDSVVDGQLGGAGEAAELLQATHSHVGEAKPVSHTELRQQTALHHLVQLVQWRAPQAAGIHPHIRTHHMLEKEGTVSSK